jgi:hypothetical protein
LYSSIVIAPSPTTWTQATCPRDEPAEPAAHQATDPRVGWSSTGTPAALAAAFQLEALPQWTFFQ